MRMCHFRVQNSPICSEQFLLVQTIIITFIYLLALFIVQNFKKNLTADPELWGYVIFVPKMVDLTQKYFLKKIIKIIYIYILAPFILQNLKNFLEPIQNYEDVPFSVPKYPSLSWTKIFGKKHYYHFHLPIGPFQWRKFKKKILQWIQDYEDASFLDPKWSICPKEIFFLKKIINIIFIYLLASFIVQKFLKSLTADLEL